MKGIIAFVCCLVSLITQAESLEPVTWSFALSSKEVHVGDTIEVIATAAIIPDWYLYSNDFDPDLGPTITEFKFVPDEGYKLLGKPKAIKPKKKYDPIWEGDVTYFVDHAEFRQKIIILNNTPRIVLSVNFQTCTEGKCVPGETEFEYTFSGANEILPAKAAGTKKSAVAHNTLPETTSTDPDEKASLKELEAAKSKLIQRDASGNDVSVDYLKSFVKKYSK